MSAINSTPQGPTAETNPVPLSLPDLSKATDAERPKLELEILKLRLDIHKWRADEYRSRYEGLRTLEWNTILQMYAGYAAIAVAFNYVHGLPEFHGYRPLAWLAITGTLIFYLASRYLSYRIQERLVRFDQTQDNYAEKVSKELHIEPPKPGGSSLHHQYYWT